MCRHLMVATTIVAALFGSPAVAAAIDVTRAGDGVVWVRGTAADEQVTIDRSEDGQLRVRDHGEAATSSDASCTADPVDGSVSCDGSTSMVRVVLAGGADSLDATGAELAALVFNGGAGADTVRPTGARFTRIWDATTTDTVDVSAFDGATQARWHRGQRRVALTCPDCGSRRIVLLSGRPGTVVLGAGNDDVDLRAWRVRGGTRWLLAGGNDRFHGSHVRRSNADGGAGADQLVSYAPRDVLRGGDDADKLADFGGRGDVLLGGRGIDALASMDRQRDTLDGQGDRDMCLAPRGRMPRDCDTGPVRGIEGVSYLPLTSQAWVFRMLGLR